MKEIENHSTPPNRKAPDPWINKFLIGTQLVLVSILFNPYIFEAAFSSTGDMQTKLFIALGIVSVVLLVIGVGMSAVALRNTRRRKLALVASGALFLFYAFLFVVADRAFNAIAPIQVSGRLDVPKAQVYGWGFTPGGEVTIVHPDTNQETKEHVNTSGWRDVEHDLKKTKPRILLLGDSQVYGHGLTLENTIGRQLEQVLEGKFEVLQMGMGGYGTDQEYLILTHEGLDWDPDYVVLLFTMGNDVMDNMHAVSFLGTAPKPSFELQDGKLVAREFEGTKPSFLRRLFGKSYISRFVRQQRSKQKTQAGLQLLGGRDGEGHVVLKENPDQLDDIENDYSGYAIFKDEEDWSQKLKAGWEVTLALIKAMNEAASEHGAEFILYPNYQFPEGHEFTVESDLKTWQLDATGPQEKLDAFAQENDIPFIQEPEWMKEANTQGELSFENDGHLSEYGALKVAELIADKVLRLENQSRVEEKPVAAN